MCLFKIFTHFLLRSQSFSYWLADIFIFCILVLCQTHILQLSSPTPWLAFSLLTLYLRNWSSNFKVVQFINLLFLRYLIFFSFLIVTISSLQNAVGIVTQDSCIPLILIPQMSISYHICFILFSMYPYTYFFLSHLRVSCRCYFLLFLNTLACPMKKLSYISTV